MLNFFYFFEILNLNRYDILSYRFWDFQNSQTFERIKVAKFNILIISNPYKIW